MQCDVLCLTSAPVLALTPHQTTEAWWGRDLYPVNALRNVALKAATTDLVLLLDIDFVPNAGLHARLEAMQQDMLSKPWTATVLPAFEVRQVLVCVWFVLCVTLSVYVCVCLMLADGESGAARASRGL